MSLVHPASTRTTSRSVDLPFALSTVRQARGIVAADLASVGVDEAERTDVLLVLSEILGNSVRHARPLPGDSVRVLWRTTVDEIEVAVADGGAVTRPRAERPPFAALSGRGLGIVDALSGTWGVEGAGSEYQLVWAVLPRGPREV